MNESTNNAVATTPEEVTDATVDTYFESGGEDGVSDPEPTSSEEDSHQEEKAEPEVEPTKDEEDKPEVEVPESSSVDEDKKTEIGHNLNAALKQEREKRKGLSSELEQTKGQLQQVQEMMDNLLGAQEAEQGVKYEDDPIEHLRQSQDRINKQLESQQQKEQAIQQQNQYTQAQNKLLGSYQNSAMNFRKANNDFDDAYKFLTEGRMAEHKAAGYSEEEARILLTEDEYAIAAKAITDDADPAERIYQLAKVRGYSRKTQEAQPNKLKHLEQVEKGQRTNQSLSDAQGGSGNKKLAMDNLSLKDIDRLSDADLDKVFSQMRNGG